MAKGKAERKSGGGAQEMEQEQKLQAILLADSFNTNFRPISNDMPKVISSSYSHGPTSKLEQLGGTVMFCTVQLILVGEEWLCSTSKRTKTRRINHCLKLCPCVAA